jgi:hypothetical protein
MVIQLRIYSVLAEHWDEWVAFFENTVKPMHEQCNIPIPAAFGASETIQTENGEVRRFVWMRQFTSVAAAPAALEVYRNSPERQALDPTFFKQALVGSEAFFIEPIAVAALDPFSVTSPSDK